MNQIISRWLRCFSAIENLKAAAKRACLPAILLVGVTGLRAQTHITDVSGLAAIDGSTDAFIITGDIDVSTLTTITSFGGTLEAAINPATHMPYRLTGLTQPLFATLTGTVRNMVLDEVGISGHSGNTGAIACTASGSARIYNVGILGGSVGGTAYTGGLVGLLDGEARVINCFSYADITAGNYVGGIVGYNNVATTSDNLKTMVMNCMFYGDITGGTNKAPVYNGQIITNRGDQDGVGNYNYFRAEATYVRNRDINTYNCALLAETRYLQRFEFFRHLLNGHRELAAWWATGDAANKDMMMKWVMEPSQIGSTTPYPILKTPGKYPSVVNIDAEHATAQAERNKGGLLGTLTVNIRMGSGGAQFAAPTGAEITTAQLALNVTDKDPDHFNFNYSKVQLPFYNDVGTKNYTGNRVVTGWKIVGITTDGSVASYNSFTTGEDATANAEGEITATPYNFADRRCIDKDLYANNGGRVFNQGAYWDVPEGVTSITIEPYWAMAAYVADSCADVVYNKDMGTAYNVPTVGGGLKYTNGQTYSIAGEDQIVYTSVANARNALGEHAGHTVYDYAIVLVGNTHNIGVSSNSTNYFYTIMSADFDHDNEPDYSYILRFDSRAQCHPVRVDFLNMPGLGMAQKSTGGTGSYNFGILQPISWFETTNTSLFRVTQFEYDRSNRIAAPLILQGGVMEQWVSGQNNGAANRTTYYHVGGNVWFKEFHRGCHQDNTYTSKHPPISVTGGDYDEFYLTGLYRGDIANFDDNAECYINGGRFGTVCGAAMEGIGKANGADNTGNISWLIQNADIREFFAGGLNAAKPVTGNLSTTIVDSHVDIFCGGPKFGDMSTGKTVVTNATGCTFGTFFGAGYGGNSYSRYAPTNQKSVTNINWNNWVSGQYTRAYNATYVGVSTRFSYQFLPMSDNKTNVARILIDFVKFSLATTHEVTSSLKHCSITDNFYGGGSLGKVDGSVTSILDSCTVNGNVYGAGFSASLPTVEVDSIGFRTEPYYYDALGSYRTGVKGQTTTYTWEEGNSISVDNTNHILYTTEDLDALGTVGGNVTLTLKGTTTVGTLEGGSRKAGTGNVFGGGDMSGVIGGGNTTVILQQGATVLGDVFGGGNQGAVGGNSSVKLQ